MSTLQSRREKAERAGVAAPVRSSLVARLIAARENAVRRRVLAYLRDMPDERLANGLGLSPEEIAALRADRPFRI